MNKYIATIMSKHDISELEKTEMMGFFSKKDREPAPLWKRTTYNVGSIAISLGAIYYIWYPKTMKLIKNISS